MNLKNAYLAIITFGLILFWFGSALPHLISADNNELPIIGIFLTPIVIWLVVKITKSVYTSVIKQYNKKENK